MCTASTGSRARRSVGRGRGRYFRGLLGLGAEGAPELPPEPRLSGRLERGAYVAGLACGLALFSALRGLLVPQSWSMWLVPGCLLSLLVALWCGLFRRS